MSVNHQTPTAVHRSVLTLKAAIPVTVQVVTCLTLMMECLALVRSHSICREEQCVELAPFESPFNNTLLENLTDIDV